MRVFLGACALLLVVLCAPAGASTVTYQAGYVEPPGTPPEESCSRYGACPPATLELRGAPGERNVVTVSREGANLVFRDAAAPLAAGAGCTARDDGSVACPAGVTNALLEDGDDSFQATGTTVAGVRGGDGADTLSGALTLSGDGGDDVLTGGDGNETFAPGQGRDTVTAGGGDDVVTDDVTPEADRLDGGDGRDTVQFTGRGLPVRVDLGLRPQMAGSTGEGNDVAGFEAAHGGEGDDDLASDPAAPPTDLVVLSGLGGNDMLDDRHAGDAGLTGGPGNDTLLGGGGASRIDGGPGTDVVDGRGGNDQINGDEGGDTLRGGDGRDVLLGSAGDDEMTGGRGDDRMSGFTGRDVMRGGSGRDVLNGGGGNDSLFGDAGADRLLGAGGRDRLAGFTGNDRLDSRDRSADRIDCGPGRDRLTGDRRDRQRRCERSSRSVRRSR